MPLRSQRACCSFGIWASGEPITFTTLARELPGCPPRLFVSRRAFKKSHVAPCRFFSFKLTAPRVALGCHARRGCAVSDLTTEWPDAHWTTAGQKRGIMKLSFARIVTTDVGALANFYREVTGIAPTFLSDAYVEFVASGAALAISSQQTMDAYGARATQAGSNRSVVFDFQVDDVDLERIRLGRLVREFVLEPTNQPWGNRSMLFRDPDGNLINFFAPIRAGRVSTEK